MSIPTRPSGPAPWLRALCALVALSSARLIAGEASHYVGGSFNPRDFFVPPGDKAVYIVAPYVAGFSSTALRDSAGNELNSLGPLNLDLDVDTWQTMVMFIGNPGKKILGGDYGFMAMLAYGETTVAGRLSQTRNGGASFNSKTTGVMDLMVQPLMLTWTSGRWDRAINYTFWAPTGKFDPAGGGVGLGYWTHLVRGSVSYAFDDYRLRTLTLTTSLDFKSEKKGLDLRPGTHLNVEGGYNRVVSAAVQWGVFGWGTWQVTDDSGSAASLPRVHDRVFGAGAYASYWFQPGKTGALLRYTRQFGARDQFEGDTVALGVNLIF